MSEKIIMRDKYGKIIEFICRYNNINNDELFKILKDQELRYLMLLLLEEYKCVDFERICSDFSLLSSKGLKQSMKKAEKKLFINREFRELYFELEEMIKKII